MRQKNHSRWRGVQRRGVWGERKAGDQPAREGSAPAYWVGRSVGLFLPLLLRAFQAQHIQPPLLLICQLQKQDQALHQRDANDLHLYFQAVSLVLKLIGPHMTIKLLTTSLPRVLRPAPYASSFGWHALSLLLLLCSPHDLNTTYIQSTHHVWLRTYHQVTVVAYNGPLQHLEQDIPRQI